VWILTLVVVQVFMVVTVPITDLAIVPGILNRPGVGGTIVRAGKPLLLADAGMTVGRIIMLLLRRG
jgi:hypothetical protein